MISRFVYMLVAGALGGLLGWLVSEPVAPGEILPHGVDPNAPEWADLYRRLILHQNLLGGGTGLFVGAFVAGISGWLVGSIHHMQRGILWGGAAGLVAGLVSVQIAAQVYDALMRAYVPARAVMAGSLVALFARAVGWGIFGCLLGAGQAIATRSWQRVRQAAIGGLIGGTVGGILFELLAPVFQPIALQLEPGRQEIGRLSRVVGLVCVGGGIGLFIGLVELLMRSAWIRVLQGRNEGKEYLVDAKRTVIGRSERADIPLFGDPAVAPEHAVIERSGREYTLVALQPGCLVNGQPAQAVTLRDGDAIQVGRFLLQFRLKAGRAVRPATDVRRPSVPSAPLTRPGTCQFCGQPKDPSGNCACSPARQPSTQPSADYSRPLGVSPTAIVVLDGPKAGARLELGVLPLTIGRDPSQGLCLAEDPLASRKHARIQMEAEGFVVYDEGSTNGTVVNGVRIVRQVLSPGDVLTIGSTNLRVE